MALIYQQEIMETRSNIDFKSSQKSLDNTKTLFCRKKSLPMTFADTTTSNSTNISKRNEMGKILLKIMNKMFSARVVLEQLPSPVVPKLDPAEMPVTRIKSKGNSIGETTFKRLGDAYLKVCQKCNNLFPRRKIHCKSCNIELLFECQRCHKQFTTYKRVQNHINNKCFLRGYYHCSECDFKSTTTLRVIGHMENLHPSVKYDKKTMEWTDAKMISIHKCSRCGKQFDDHESLNKHIRLCSKAQEIIKLANSSKQIVWNKDFQKMIIKFCPTCKEDKKLYDGGVTSELPCQKCGSAMKFKCSRCSKEYETYNGCSYHTKVGCKSMRIPKPHPRYGSVNTIHCPRCQKPFVQEAWFQRHLLKCKGPPHSKPRNHRRYKHLKATCERCHEGQRICDRRKICRKCKSNLHFQCKTCEKNFNADYDCWCEHLKTLFDETRYVCNDCGLGMLSRNTILKHVKICNRDSFHCKQCNYTTKIKHRMRNHVLFKHPIHES